MRKTGAGTQVSLLDGLGGAAKGNAGEKSGEIPDLGEWDHRELLMYEKEALGFYITGHPLLRYREKLELVTNANSENLAERRDKEEVLIAGIVSGIREVTTKRKDVMAYVTIEDLYGSLNIICFADVYQGAKTLLKGEEPLLIKGQLDVAEESIKIIAGEIRLLQDAPEISPYSTVHFHVDSRIVDDVGIILSIKDLANKYKGTADGFIHLLNGETETIVYLGADCRFHLNADFMKESRRLLGPNAVRCT